MMKIKLNTTPGILKILLMTILCTGSLTAQTVWWTGAGDGSSWNDPGNWNTAVVPTTNNMANTVPVYLGYADGGNVPDTPQAITLTANTAIWGIVVAAEGNRQVTVSGSSLTFPIRADVITIDADAESETTFSCDLGIYRRANLKNPSTQDLIIAGNMFRPTPDLGSGGYEIHYYGGNNKLRLQGTSIGPFNHWTGGIIICETDGQSVERWQPKTAAASLHLAANANIGSMTVSAPSNVIRRIGSADRVVSVGEFMGLDNTATAKAFLAPGEPGQGHLTFRVKRFVDAYVETSADSTVEIITHSTTDRRRMAFADNPGITGPGSVRLNMTFSVEIFTVERAMNYTGTTRLDTGVLLIGSTLVGETTVYGALSPASPVTVNSNATLRLHADHAETVGGLGGSGTVQLRGTSLTVRGVGLAAGTHDLLRVEDAGAVILAGTNVISFSSNTNAFDKVALTGAANLTLGGVLEITAPEGFFEYGSGRYTLFGLGSGSISGSFATIVPPAGMIAEIETDDGDVVLLLSQTPNGTVIVVQ